MSLYIRYFYARKPYTCYPFSQGSWGKKNKKKISFRPSIIRASFWSYKYSGSTRALRTVRNPLRRNKLLKALRPTKIRTENSLSYPSYGVVPSFLCPFTNAKVLFLFLFSFRTHTLPYIYMQCMCLARASCVSNDARAQLISSASWKLTHVNYFRARL